MFDKTSRIRSRARKHYLGYFKAAEHLDCGFEMAETVSKAVLDHKIEFNRAMDELAALDPACPSTRL